MWGAALVMIFTGSARGEERTLRLTLKEAIRTAVENNLDVKVELYNPAASGADIYRASGIYNPMLNFTTNYQDSSTLGNSYLTGIEATNRQKNYAFNGGISQLLATGGTVAAMFNNGWYSTNSGLTAFTNYFQSNVTLNVNQPLLKNFGRETVEVNINVAKFNKEGALEQFRVKLQDTVSRVKTQYNQLYGLYKNLEAKNTSLKLAETILGNTRAQVNAGVLPAMEILNAQFGVANQQKALIDAERALKDQIDVLRLLLQLHEVADIVPVDTPFRDEYPLDEAAEIKRALEVRPDLRQQRIALKASELQTRVAKTQTLPQLDLTTSAVFTGLAESYNRDLERLGSGQYPIWTVGLQLTYPIGNDSARNDYIRNRLKVEQVRTQIKSLEESVGNEVRAAVRGVRSSYRQLDVTARGRTYAEEVFQAYQKKQKVGLATTKDVLDVLNNLVNAQAAEIQSVADYNNAIVSLWKATGELLDREGVTMGEKEADDLYARNR
jgi:outer membrane protein TolC